LPKEDALRLRVHEAPEVGYEASLADSGLPGQRHELNRRLAQRPGVRVPQQRELVLPADERRLRRLLDVDPEAAASTLREPDRKRPRLALDRDRLELLVLDRVLGRVERLLTHDESSDRRRLLDPGGGIDDVPRHEALALGRPRSERHNRLACVDRRAYGEPEPRLCLVQLLDRLEDAQPGAHGTLGIVLVGDGRAEGSHDGVADELLDRAPEVLDRLLHARVVGVEPRPDVLGIRAIGAGGETDEVDEEDRDDLALLLARRGRSEGRSAGEAETRPLRALLPALRTDTHGLRPTTV